MSIWLLLDDEDDEKGLLRDGVDVWLGVELDLLDEDIGVVGDGDVLLCEVGDNLMWRKASGWIEEGIGANVVLCSEGLSWGFIDSSSGESELLL